MPYGARANGPLPLGRGRCPGETNNVEGIVWGQVGINIDLSDASICAAQEARYPAGTLGDIQAVTTHRPI